MKTKLLLLFTSVFLLISSQLYAQQEPSETEKGEVNWLTMEEAQQQFAENPKTIMVFVHSQNCDSCQMMQDSTFALKEVADYINVTTYPVKYNPETATGELPFALPENAQLPLLVCLDKNGSGGMYQGYKSRDNIFPILTYYWEGVYQATPFEEYQESYFEAFPPGQRQVVSRLIIKPLTVAEALERHAVEPRKFIFHVYRRESTQSTVMFLSTLNNPVIAEYINSHFYFVRLEASTQDTIEIFDTTFVNNLEEDPFHDFTKYLAARDLRMVVPTTAFFDENLQFINREQVFLSKKRLEPMLHYVAEDKYKTVPFPDFIKNFEGNFTDEESP